MYRASRKLNDLRGAFTLIELMVVIAIIALLVALSAGAVMRYLTTQKGNNTETTIGKIDSVLKTAWLKVIDQARNDSIPSGIDTAFGCNGDASLQRVIYVKLKLMQQFPMNFTEAVNGPPVLGPEPAYGRYLAPYNPPLNSPPLIHESSACLLMALQLDRSRMNLQMDQIGGDQIKTLPSGLPFLADGWEQPLAFYRWPTLNPEVNLLNKSTTPAMAIKRDTQDPEGKLMDPTWWGSSGCISFVNVVHGLGGPTGLNPPLAGPPSPLPNPASVFLVPVIASAGPNKKIGITPVVTSTPNGMADDGTGDANDNLYNFRLSLGGKGD